MQSWSCNHHSLGQC
ncbi:hypothetical protein AMTRI_Chr03g140050 [Amborella trichopoda]